MVDIQTPNTPNVDTNTTNVSTGGQASGSNTETPQVTQTQETTTTASASTTPEKKKGQSVMMPSSALKDIKAKAAERGKREALAALDEEAKKLGFANHEALKLAAAQAKAGGGKQTPKGKPNQGKTSEANANPPKSEQPDATPQSTDRNTSKWQRETQQLLEDKRRLNKRKNALEKQLAEQNAAIQREQTLRQLSRMATRAGIVGDDENDLAITLYEKHVSSLSDDELDNFDDEKFFAEHLRNSKPYLYGVREVPANTSPNQSQSASSASTSTPTPSTSTQSQSSKRPDATSMSKQEWQHYLASRGLTNPSR